MLLSISCGNVEKLGVVRNSDMDCLSVLWITAFTIVQAFLDIAPCVRTVKFNPYTLFFSTVSDRSSIVHTDGVGIHSTEGEPGYSNVFMSLIQVDKWGDIFPFAEEISGEITIGRV